MIQEFNLLYYRQQDLFGLQYDHSAPRLEELRVKARNMYWHCGKLVTL